MDNVVTFLDVIKVMPNRIWIKSNNYGSLTDIFEIFRRKSEDFDKTIVQVLGLKANTNLFMMQLLFDKFYKEDVWVIALLHKENITWLKREMMIGFLSFCAKMIPFDWVFMQLLGDFVAIFFFSRWSFW